MAIASCFPRFSSIIISSDGSTGFPEPDPGELGRLLAKFRLEDKTGLTDGEFRTLDLSGGQRRRLALIVSLLEKRPILLLDEWTAEQDPEYRRKFYDELLPEMMRAGKTVVVITHDDRYLDELHLPARRIHMEEGRIVEQRHNGRLTAFDEERLMAKYPGASRRKSAAGGEARMVAFLHASPAESSHFRCSWRFSRSPCCGVSW